MGERLWPGSIVTLAGELGCGKTVFARGVCAGLGVAERQVSSPSFVLVNEYAGRLPVFHLDMYRLDAEQGFDIGMLDYLARAGSGVMMIEWAEKILSLLPESRLDVQFQVLSARRRRIVLTGRGEKYTDLAKGLAEF